MSKIKTSLFGRTSSLLKVTASIVASEVKDRVMTMDSAQQIQAKIQLAKKMTEHMGDLKGAAMKLGQMLSIDAADYLPPEALEILSKLQKDVEPIDFSIIDAQLRSELKEKYSALEINPKALAVASIGQVHTAKYQGKEIVLKIQYPDIEKTIETDIKVMKFLMNQTSFLMQKSANLDSLFDELRNTLINETDYLLEGQHLKKAQELFKDHPHFKVPTYIEEVSTKRILAMEFMEGVSFTEWLNRGRSMKEKEEMGRKLYELFLLEFFTLGFVQTDPNPGNFLVNNEDQIVLLDYGAAKEYSPEFIKSYTQLLRAAYKNDKAAVLACSFEFDIISSKESDETLELFYKMMKCMIEPFRQNSAFNFADQTFYEDSKRYALEVSKKCKYSPPPEKLLFLHRKLGGIFQLLKKMEVRINLHEYWVNRIETL